MSPALQAWLDGGRRERLLGHELFVRVDTGPAKPPLLLIHGFPTASYDWHAVWSVLAEQFSLYALDLLGFGASAKPVAIDYRIGLQADLCAALLEKHGLQRVHLLAHDYGDTVAQELLARHHEGRVALASVVFLNGGLFPEAHRPRTIQRLLARPLLGPLLVRAVGYRRYAANMRAIGGRTPPAEAELRDQWELLCRDDGRARMPALLGYMAERRAHRARWVGVLQRSKVPLRLVCGAADPISGAHLARRYREVVPDADVVELPEVGHYPQLEAPAAVVAAIRDLHRRHGN